MKPLWRAKVRMIDGETRTVFTRAYDENSAKHNLVLRYGLAQGINHLKQVGEKRPTTIDASPAAIERALAELRKDSQ